MDPKDELARALALYREVCTRQLHYHKQIWESARLFFWAFTVPMSTSFFFFFDDGARSDKEFPFDVLSIVLALLAFRIAVYGRRALLQERTFFAFEREVRKRLEAALGWQIDHPRIAPLYRSVLRTTFGIRDTDFEYELLPESGVKLAELRFKLDEQNAIRIAMRGRAGAFGVFTRMFSYAMAIALIALTIFTYRVGQRHGLWTYIGNTTGITARWSGGGPDQPKITEHTEHVVGDNTGDDEKRNRTDDATHESKERRTPFPTGVVVEEIVPTVGTQ